MILNECILRFYDVHFEFGHRNINIARRGEHLIKIVNSEDVYQSNHIPLLSEQRPTEKSSKRTQRKPKMQSKGHRVFREKVSANRGELQSILPSLF